jgi:hypothetical protein
MVRFLFRDATSRARKASSRATCLAGMAVVQRIGGGVRTQQPTRFCGETSGLSCALVHEYVSLTSE